MLTSLRGNSLCEPPPPPVGALGTSSNPTNITTAISVNSCELTPVNWRRNDNQIHR